MKRLSAFLHLFKDKEFIYLGGDNEDEVLEKLKTHYNSIKNTKYPVKVECFCSNCQTNHFGDGKYCCFCGKKLTIIILEECPHCKGTGEVLVQAKENQNGKNYKRKLQ